MRKPFFGKDPVEKRLDRVKAEIAKHEQKRELAKAEAALATLNRVERYAGADPSERARLDVEAEVASESRRQRVSRHGATVRARIEARKRLIQLPPDAIRLLAAAKEESIESVTIHAQEGILDAINGTPFGFDLIAEYRNLLQVPTLIRELWPYKPTILRTLPMLDFARWVCRVVYEECLTAKGLVKGKVNYICRGMRAKVVLRDPDEATAGETEKMAAEEDEKGDGEQPTEAAGETAEQPQVDEAMKEAQKLLDDFIDKRNYLELRRERRRRMMIEGESFLWISQGKEDEPPTVCFVEPDYIRPSQKESRNQEDPHISGFGEEDWSFGILTPRHQYWNPQAYQIVWNDLSEEKVSAQDMFHTAIRERSNIKRCLPPMFAMVDDLIRMTLLRAALADASKFRASIGGVVKYEEASQEAVRNWEETISGGRLGDTPDTVELQPIESTAASNILSLTAGRDFVQGPAYPDVGSLELIYLWHIRAIAQAEQVPEWLVSGAMAEGSYASSLTAESVSVIEFDAEQEKDCATDRLVLRRVMELYQEKNLLDTDFFEKYDISVEGESMVSRDAKSEAETAVIHVQNEFCSLTTAQANLGFNSERERALIDAEKALGVGPVSQQAALGEDGEEEFDSGPQTMGGQMKVDQGEEGWDESKHPRGQPENAGEFGPGGGGKKSSGTGKQPTKFDRVPKLRRTTKRAFDGKATATKAQLAKHETGKLGESIIIGFLKQIRGKKDARHLNDEENNFPVDLIQNHDLVESKAGVVSSQTPRWRLTIGEPGKEEKAWLANASADEKAAHNAKKQAEIKKRKEKVLKDVSKAVGRKVRAKTFACIINPDTRTADIYEFDGWHDSIPWRSEQAAAGYVGSYSYE